jgi:hypothetical protein
LRADTDGRSWHARLPCATTEVRIVSKVWTPSHIRADETDERRLGIAVSRLWLGGREMDLDSPGLAAGWHAREAFWRWTDGDGVLETAGATDLAFEVAMAGTYWRDRNARRRLQA